MTTIPNIDFSDGIVKKELHVFYLLDVSGSMAGTAIAQLNQGIKSTIDALRQKLGDSTESHLKISIMRFSNKFFVFNVGKTALIACKINNNNQFEARTKNTNAPNVNFCIL